jgi:hypothetical protein
MVDYPISLWVDKKPEKLSILRPILGKQKKI